MVEIPLYIPLSSDDDAFVEVIGEVGETLQVWRRCFDWVFPKKLLSIAYFKKHGLVVIPRNLFFTPVPPQTPH